MLERSKDIQKSSLAVRYPEEVVERKESDEQMEEKEPTVRLLRG